VLIGQPAPEVKALVAHHDVPHYGALRGSGRSEIGRVIAVLRASAPLDPAVDAVVPLIADIRAAADEPVSTFMAAHILFGSQGPQVTALRERTHLPHDGELKSLGIKCVLALVRAVEAAARHASADSDPAGPATE